VVCTPTTTSSRSGASSEPVRRTALVAPLPGSSGCHALLQQQSLPSATTNYHENRICLTAARSGRGMRCWNHLKQRQFLYHSSFVSPRLKGHVAGIPTAASHPLLRALPLEFERGRISIAACWGTLEHTMRHLPVSEHGATTGPCVLPLAMVGRIFEFEFTPLPTLPCICCLLSS